MRDFELSQHSRLSRWGGIRLAVAVLAVAITSLFATPVAEARGCANADLAPTNDTEVALATAATKCLLNNARHRHHKRGLHINRKLGVAAAAQAKDMLANRYFDHVRRGGPAFISRFRKAGYLNGVRGYSVGENIAWSPADDATPREMVNLWLRSRGHRANIMNKSFRDTGIAIVRVENAPGGDYPSGGAITVFVNNFGRRY